jgi:hypothetical protein
MEQFHVTPPNDVHQTAIAHGAITVHRISPSLQVIASQFAKRSDGRNRVYLHVLKTQLARLVA